MRRATGHEIAMLQHSSWQTARFWGQPLLDSAVCCGRNSSVPDHSRGTLRVPESSV